MTFDLMWTMNKGVYTWFRFHSDEERTNFIRKHKSWNLKTFDKRK